MQPNIAGSAAPSQQPQFNRRPRLISQSAPRHHGQPQQQQYHGGPPVKQHFDSRPRMSGHQNYGNKQSDFSAYNRHSRPHQPSSRNDNQRSPYAPPSANGRHLHPSSINYTRRSPDSINRPSLLLASSKSPSSQASPRHHVEHSDSESSSSSDTESEGSDSASGSSDGSGDDSEVEESVHDILAGNSTQPRSPDEMSKEEITAKMDNLDDEISKYENMVDTLHRQRRDSQVLLAKQSDSRPMSPVQPTLHTASSSTTALDLMTTEPTHDESEEALVDRCLQENRFKAKKAVVLPLLNVLEASYTIPIYTRPSDCSFYDVNLKKHEKLLPELTKALSKRQHEEEDKVMELTNQYYELYDAWSVKVAKWESHQRKKQMKLLSRVANTSAASSSLSNSNRRRGMNPSANSDPLMNHPAAGDYDPTTMPFAYLNPEEEFRYLKTLAFVPRMSLFEAMEPSPLHREPKYTDNNGTFEDSIHAIRNRNSLNPWTPEEKRVFVEMFMEVPKQFGKISAALQNKSAQDCVLFYYLNKKSLKLKALCRAAQSRSKKRKRLELAAELQPLHAPVSRERESSFQADDASDVHHESPRIYQGGVSVEFEESFWTSDDLQTVKCLFAEFGKDFFKVAEHVGTRTVLECRNLYLAYKRERGIDLTVAQPPIDVDVKSVKDPSGGIPDSGAFQQHIQQQQQQVFSDKDGTKKERIKRKIGKEKEIAIAREVKEKRGRQSLSNKPEEQPPVEGPQPTEEDHRKEQHAETSLVESGAAAAAVVEDSTEKKKPKRGRPAKARLPSVQAAINAAEVHEQQHHDDGGSPPGSPIIGEDGKKEKRKTISYWTAKEKHEFMKFFKQFGKNWKALAEAIPTKSEIQIRNYYQNHKFVLGLVEERRGVPHDTAGDRHSEAKAQSAKLISLLNEKDSSSSENLKITGASEDSVLPQTIFPYALASPSPNFPAGFTPYYSTSYPPGASVPLLYMPPPVGFTAASQSALPPVVGMLPSFIATYSQPIAPKPRDLLPKTAENGNVVVVEHVKIGYSVRNERHQAPNEDSNSGET